MSSTDLIRSIYQTLAYADVFRYPLTAAETWRYLVGAQPVSLAKVEQTLGAMVLKPEAGIGCQGGYYYLSERGDLAAERVSRAKIAFKKRRVIQKSLPLIRAVPSVLLVGLTGALTMNVADPGDDIDLLIVTKKGMLWVTRLMVNLILDVVGRRRKPDDISVKDKLCLNMFIDELELSLPEEERDVFSAHEAVQMEPLVDRSGIYPKFLRANNWVKHYLANGYEGKIKDLEAKGESEETTELVSVAAEPLLRLAEPLARKIQLKYMESRVTNEVLDPNRIRFHPQDARGWVLPAYQKRLDLLGERTGLSLVQERLR